MARKRIVDPEFWGDEKIATLPPNGKLLFVGTWNFADDEGIIRWNAAYLKSNIFPYAPESFIEEVKLLMELLVEKKFVFPYTAGETKQPLAWIINFRKYQTINHPQPTKLNPPDIQLVAVRQMYFERDKYICQICDKEIEVTSVAGKMLGVSLDYKSLKNVGRRDGPSNIITVHDLCSKNKATRSITHYSSDSRSDSSSDSSLIEFNVIKSNLIPTGETTNVDKSVDNSLKSAKEKLTSEKRV